MDRRVERRINEFVRLAKGKKDSRWSSMDDVIDGIQRAKCHKLLSPLDSIE